MGASAAGFKIVAAGKGTRYHPTYHQSTPDTVWDILDTYMKFKDEDRGSINPKMFNSFVDGTKSGIEMTAICNATGLHSQTEGLSFPPASRFELAEICKPKSDGGVLEKKGVTEVTSSLYRDGSDVPHNLVMGTYVVFEAAEDNDYSRRCFTEYSMLQDKSGRYAALYRPIHMIGLELGHLGRLGGAAQGGDRRADLLQLRRRRDRQARTQGRRDARRRGRLLRLGQADPGRRLARSRATCRSASRTTSSSRTRIKQGERLKWSDVEIDESDLAVARAARWKRLSRRPNIA